MAAMLACDVRCSHVTDGHNYSWEMKYTKEVSQKTVKTLLRVTKSLFLNLLLNIIIIKIKLLFTLLMSTSKSENIEEIVYSQ